MTGPWRHAFEPGIRPTVLRQVYLAQVRPGRYRELSGFHYRGHGLPPGTSQAFAAFYRRRARAVADPEADRLVGIVLYGLCLPRHRMRSVAFGRRYTVGGLAQSMARLNREVRNCSRVVVDPQFRGIGLAWRLLAATLPRVGTPYVESSAAMGAVNPFFVRAGFRRYPAAPGAADERIAAALRASGFDMERVGLTDALAGHVASLAPPLRTWLIGEIRRSDARFTVLAAGKRRDWSLEAALRRLAKNVTLRPDYFLWVRGEDPGDTRDTGA